MKNTKIVVNTRSKSYPIYFGDGNLNTTGTLIKKNLPNVKKICIISDKNLPLVLLKKLSKSLKKYNKIPINSIPIICPTPHKNPIRQCLFFVSKTKGVTAAKWSGPINTWVIAAIKPIIIGKL